MQECKRGEYHIYRAANYEIAKREFIFSHFNFQQKKYAGYLASASDFGFCRVEFLKWQIIYSLHESKCICSKSFN